jgi:hypothetical protein
VACQVGEVVRLLEAEGVAFDVGAYRAAPPGIRSAMLRVALGKPANC